MDFFIVRPHSLEWGFDIYYPLPPYHPVSVLNTTSRVVFWHTPSEFFFLILDLTMTLWGFLLLVQVVILFMIECEAKSGKFLR